MRGLGEYRPACEMDALPRTQCHEVVQAVLDQHCGADLLVEQRQIEEVERAVIDVIETAIE